MKSVVLFPIWVIIIAIGWVLFWVAASIYIFSAGETKSKDSGAFANQTFTSANYLPSIYTTAVPATYEVLDYDKTVQGTFAPHFFMFLWVNQWLVYFTFTVVSGAIADWYVILTLKKKCIFFLNSKYIYFLSL